jgi:DNA-binding PadR family transcriptional regulator
VNVFEGTDPRSHDTRERGPHDVREAQGRDPSEVFARGLNLPHGPDRERVLAPGGREYALRGSEVRALATIGAFRVVAADDLRDDRGRRGDVRHGDLERLQEAGLIRTVAPLDHKEPTSIVTLTEQGRALLESHRTPGVDRPQTLFDGAVKPRELSHDAQAYRAFVRTAERIHTDGGRVDRVILDYELKRDYQRFLQEGNRGRADSDGRPTRTPDEVQAWAREHDLPMVDGRLQFPDFRIEYEHADGRRDVEDVEVTTLHYRGAHASGKDAAGFTQFRASTARIGGSNGHRGGAPFDPHAAEELLG